VFAAVTHRRRGETGQAGRCAETAIAYAAQHELSDGLMFATALRGWTLCRTGGIAEGLDLIQRAQAGRRGEVMPVPLLAIVAESYADAGRSGEGMAAVDRAIATAERDADRFCLSELYRLRGELLLLGRTPLLRREAERHFDRAIEVARGQGARLFELLATIRLCRLRYEAGSGRALSRVLAALYDSFTEGRRTPTVSEARTLLDAIG
jgi:hypothetical protein